MPTTCIIPAHNEAPRLPYVLTQLSHVHNLDQIIVVNDGSTDDTAAIVRHFPKVILANHECNRGKTEAIKTGLALAEHDNILLFDADIDHFQAREVKRSIDVFSLSPLVDMLVYRTMNDRWPQKLVRADIALCGERILRKNNLTQILTENISGYQLEVAINHYFLLRRKNIVWVPFSGLGPNKLHKFGYAGILQDIKMALELIRYRGIVGYFTDLLRFHATQI